MTYEELGNYLIQRTDVGRFIVVLHQKYEHDHEYLRCVEYFVHTSEDNIEYDYDFNEGQQCIVVDGIFDIDNSEMNGIYNSDESNYLILKGAVKHE